MHTYRLTTGWFSEHFHVVVVGDPLDGSLTLRIKLADITGRVDFCEVNSLLSNQHTLPHDLLGLLQVDGQVVVSAVNAPHRVFNFHFVKKLPIYHNLEKRERERERNSI